MEHDVFISYSSRNKEAAQAVCHVLEQNRIRCWMAPRDIPGGGKFGDCIVNAIKATKVLVVLFSKDAAESHGVASEINIAITESKNVIPFRLDQTPLEGNSRYMLNTIHWIDAYPDYKKKFEELVKNVAQTIGKDLNGEVVIHSPAQTKESWYRSLFNNDFHPLLKFVIGLQIIIYGFALLNFSWTMVFGCLAFYHHFQLSLLLLCVFLGLSLFSTVQLRTHKILWWAVIALFDYIEMFYLCVVSKYLYANWSSFSALQIPASMRYRFLYLLGESMGDNYFIHPYLLLFAISHTILICAVLSIRYKGKIGWQLFD